MYCSKTTLLVLSMSMAISASAASAQTPAKPATATPATFRGCLQGDSTKGFALLSPAKNPDGTASQMKTYQVVGDTKLNLASMTNKVVDISGRLSTKANATGNIPSTDALGGRKIVDSGHTAPTSPEEGTQMWADGTLTARSVKQVETSCATASTEKKK